MDFDLLESVRARLARAGIENIHSRLADAAVSEEFTVVLLGAAQPAECFFDRSMDIPVTVSIVCLRVSDFQAMQDANAAFDALAADPPESINGSYTLTGMDITLPSPVTWDATGRLAWALEASLTIERKA